VALAEPLPTYSGPIYLDSDRQLLFGPHFSRRSLNFRNLTAGNDVEITLRWTQGLEREIFLRIYDQFDAVVGVNERLGQDATRVVLANRSVNSMYRIEAIARSGTFSNQDRVVITISSRLLNGVEFPDAAVIGGGGGGGEPDPLVEASELLRHESNHPLIAPYLADVYRGTQIRLRVLENGQLFVRVASLPDSLKAHFPGFPWERLATRLSEYEFYLRDRGNLGLAGYARPKRVNDPQSYPWIVFRHSPALYVRIEIEQR